ncbi:MAG: putative oxidoreductase [Friedmanniella sp.]|nr:putative oxidoreductase [Friedmanniella sp.]
MPDRESVVVVGGGLAGMAAAARLAKTGHQVDLFEARPAPGGTWAAYEVDGLLVDDAPAVLTFPAPWRDLFRKSGRPLEAELGRLGFALVPAGPTRYVFADGTELDLPSDRGEQYLALTTAYGSAVAVRWRDLLDRLDDVWQTLRPLGLEREMPGGRPLTRAVRSRLWHRRSLADLARDLDHPHLGAVVRSLGPRAGASAEQTPAMVAVELAVQRTFGRWHVAPSGAETVGAGRSSLLAEALAARLSLRKVRVHLDTPVASILVRDHRVQGVRTPGGEVAADAVIATVDPWTTVNDLLPRRSLGRTRRRVLGLQPALAPTVSHRLLGDRVPTVTETVELDQDGVPRVRYRRPHPDGTLESVHDHRTAVPCPAAGAAWQGFASWSRRPLVAPGLDGLYLAGPASPGGPGPSAVLLSAALATYGLDGYPR